MAKDLILKNIIQDLLGVDVMHKSRKQHIVDARKIYSNILRNKGWSFFAIGKSLRKDHSTIIHYLKDSQVLVLMDKKYKDDFDTVTTVFEKRMVSIATGGLSRTELELEVERLREENYEIKMRMLNLIKQTK